MNSRLFQFRGQPFSATPAPRAYVALEPMESAGLATTRALRRQRGTCLLIGPTGSGKTLLAQLIAGQIQSTHHPLLLPGSVLCSRKVLLQHILHGLGVPFRQPGEGEMRLAVVDTLARQADRQRGLVVIVDEADRLDAPLLEELRAITNISIPDYPQPQLLLLGETRLEERLAEPQLASLNQRIACRCYLRAWKRDETTRYIQSQLERVGADALQLFSPEAIIALHELSGGVPRVVNQLADHAIWLASQNNSVPLDERAVQIAWADLQQLPLPAEEEPICESGNQDIIEFGELDADEDFTTQAEDELGSASVEFGSLDDEPTPSAPRMGAESLELESSFQENREDATERETIPIRWRPVVFGQPGPAEDSPATDPPTAKSRHDGASAAASSPHLYKPLIDQLRQQPH